MLWVRVLKAKHFPHTTMFESTRPSKSSHIWKALYEGMKWLQDGMQWIVGDGKPIRMWKDNWFPSGTLRHSIEGPLMPNKENWWVSSLRNNHTWNLDSLQVPPPSHLAQLIRGILVARLTRILDSFVWLQNNGICSVSLASQFLYQQQQVPLEKQLWNWIWKVKCPKKIQLFLSKAMHNRIPTRQYLAFSRPHVNVQCPRCNNSETTIHILCDCP